MEKYIISLGILFLNVTDSVLSRLRILLRNISYEEN